MDNFTVSKAANAKFDIREDEEQYVKLQDTVELLVAAGYFRARIKGLSAFDKIVGGMVWCISTCRVPVDVDLFYSDNSTIGQKIALTERIVKVLPAMKCPHSLEPHQIQGLDFIHIFPVVQFLVKKAIEAKEMYGDEVQRHSIFQFESKHKLPSDIERDAKSAMVAEMIQKVKASHNPLRVYKRKAGIECKDEAEDALYTMLEYDARPLRPFAGLTGVLGTSAEGNAAAGKQNDEMVEKAMTAMEEAGSHKLSARTVVSLVDREGLATIVGNYEKESAINRDQPKTNEELAAHLAELEDTLRQVEQDNKEDEGEDATIQAEYEAAKAGYEAAEQRNQERIALEQTADNETVNRLKQLLDEHDAIKKHENDFKAACKAEMAELEAQLERLKNTSDENTDIDALEAKALDAEKQLAAKRLEAAAQNRQIATLQRQIDRIPSQIELNQYQRRFIELYNLMASKHRETKQHYTLHNTLIDVRNYMRREIDLLNSIDDNKEKALKAAYKDSFLESLQTILKGVDDSLDKVSTRRKTHQAQRDEAFENLQHVLEKQRLYHKTVNDLKLECQKNEELLTQLKSRGINVEDI